MKLLLLHSSSTKGGARRIREIVGDDAVDWTQKNVWPSDVSKYDGAILHNRMDTRPDITCAIHPCGMPTARIIADPATRADLINRSPKIIWSNSHTSQLLLKKYLPDNIDVKFMPKPFPLTIPKALTLPPKSKKAKKTILWYWKPNWHYTKDITPEIVAQMNELSEYQIYVINNSNNKKNMKVPPGAGDHVEAVGRVDVPKWQSKFIGVVRASQGLDFGRSTYQFQAYGKWVIYTNMEEPHVLCAQRHRHIPVIVRRLEKEWKEKDRKAAWKYISTNFSEKGLQANWIAELKRVF